VHTSKASSKNVWETARTKYSPRWNISFPNTQKRLTCNGAADDFGENVRKEGKCGVKKKGLTCTEIPKRKKKASKSCETSRGKKRAGGSQNLGSFFTLPALRTVL